MVSFLAVLLLREILAWRTGETRGSRWPMRVLPFVSAMAVFAVVSSPSWIPRWEFFGSPFYHGYLSNYLWVDTYAQGHVGQAVAKYHWRDYVATHTAGDAVKRFLWGAWNVGFAIPYRVNPKAPALFILAWAGCVAAILRGPRECRLLLLFAVLQLLPLIWTNLPNPTLRVPYASTLPFELFFASYALAVLRAMVSSAAGWGGFEWPRDGLGVGRFPLASRGPLTSRPPAPQPVSRAISPGRAHPSEG